MRFPRRFGVLSALPALVAALLLPWSTARAVPSWGPDVDISDGDVNETSTSTNNQRFIALDDSNNMYVVFYDNRFKTQFDPGDVNYEIFFRYFKYNFGSPYITRVTSAYSPSKFPAIALRNWGDSDFGTMQDSGRAYIVWQDSRLFSIPLVGDPRSSTIFMRTFRTKGGTGFGPELQVSPYDSVNAATSPVVAVGDSGRVWIAWQKADNGPNSTDVYYSIYHSNTGLLDPVLPLSASTMFAGNPSIAAGPDGVLHAAWVDTRTGPQEIWTRRFVPGTGWTAEEQIVFSSASASAPSLTADHNNHVHLVWVDSRDGNNEIYYKEYVPGVGWDALDTRITANSFSQIQPYADADPMSNVHLVWTDLRNGSSNFDIFYDSRQGGAWQGNSSLVGAASDTTNSIQRNAGIAHDEFGNAFVAWTDERMPASQGKNREAFYKVGANVVTAVSASETPTLSRLLRSYPNPFNPRTRIQFALDRDAQITLRVFDVQGRVVRTLIDSYLAAGPRAVDWDGKDQRGKTLPSGAYFLRLEGGGKYLSRTINLVK